MPGNKRDAYRYKLNLGREEKKQALERRNAKGVKEFRQETHGMGEKEDFSLGIGDFSALGRICSQLFVWPSLFAFLIIIDTLADVFGCLAERGESMADEWASMEGGQIREKIVLFYS